MKGRRQLGLWRWPCVGRNRRAPGPGLVVTEAGSGPAALSVWLGLHLDLMVCFYVPQQAGQGVQGGGAEGGEGARGDPQGRGGVRRQADQPVATVPGVCVFMHVSVCVSV